MKQATKTVRTKLRAHIQRRKMKKDATLVPKFPTNNENDRLIMGQVFTFYLLDDSIPHCESPCCRVPQTLGLGECLHERGARKMHNFSF